MSAQRRRTGQEALNRLFWDPRLNRDAFVVSYSDRVVQEQLGLWREARN